MRSMSVLSLSILLIGAAPIASASISITEPILHLACGEVTIVVSDRQCAGSCSGVNIVVTGEGNCHGADGQHGEDGSPGCEGVTVALPLSGDNCHGGDGGDGHPAGDGGPGCTGYQVNLAKACRGGDGGDGEKEGG